MHVQESRMTREESMSENLSLKMKPKVPRKPLHLRSMSGTGLKIDKQSEDEQKTINWEIAKAVVAKGLMKSYELNKPKQQSSPINATLYTRRKSSHAALLSRSMPDVHVPSKKRVSASLSAESRGSIYEDGYVQINLPLVEPGTVIRADEKSGEITMIPGNPAVSSQENAKPPIRSISEDTAKLNLVKRDSDSTQHHSIVKELQQNFRTNSLDSLIDSKPKITPTVDENGYEIPLPFQKPIYLSFDSDAMTSSADETDAIDTPREPVVVVKQKKKRRLARYKRKDNTKQTPTSALASSLSKSFVIRPTNKTDEFAVKSKPIDQTDNTDDGRVKPIPSFLSDRLRTVQSDSNLGAKFAASATSDCSIPSTLAYSSSDDEWTDSSYDSYSDMECYYQQIDPPEFSGNASDHDYEVIEECLGYKKSKPVDRKKSMKSVMASVVSSRKRDKRTKSSEANKSPTDIGKSPKLQRKNMQDMRSARVADCTWETVSTPGILKLDDFKGFGRNKAANDVLTAEAY